MLPITDSKPLIRIIIILIACTLADFRVSAIEVNNPGAASQTEVKVIEPLRGSSLNEELISSDAISNKEEITSNDSVDETLLDVLVAQRLDNEKRQEKTGVDSLGDRNWWHLLKKGKLDLRDSTVKYPKFIKFCRDVYLWGDRTFNTYDTTYVVGTGTNWKARLGFDAWSDAYHINLNRNMPIHLFSTPYTSAAIYLHFMAVSINQSVDLTNLCFNKPINHKKFEFGFNCARFNLDLAFNSNTGGSYIRNFGDYNDGHPFKQYFSGVSLNSFTADLYYYFNNRKYANGAAYYFSKIQKRSAGSFILGFTYSYEDISLDFTKLPDYLLPYMEVDPKAYKFNYFNYCLLFGYGYNWVLNKHLLLNGTAMPSIGVLHANEESSEGSGKLLSLNIKGRISLTYNLNNFFICMVAKGDGHWYNSGKLSVFNAILNGSLSLGVRF